MMHRGLAVSREMFVRAIQLDPGYAPAWAGLSTVYACLHEWFGAGKVGLHAAHRASRRALELAPHLGEAHAARGFARSLSRHYDEAVSEFEQAVRINPNLFEAHYYFARTAFALGDMERAAEMFGLAAQLRAEDFQSPVLLGTALRALGRQDAAHDAVRTASGALSRFWHSIRAMAGHSRSAQVRSSTMARWTAPWNGRSRCSSSIQTI